MRYEKYVLHPFLKHQEIFLEYFILSFNTLYCLFDFFG